MIDLTTLVISVIGGMVLGGLFMMGDLFLHLFHSQDPKKKEVSDVTSLTAVRHRAIRVRRRSLGR